MTIFTAPCLSLPLWESKIRQHFLQGSARSAWPWHRCRSSGGGSNYALKEQGCQGFVPVAQWERTTPVHCKGPPSSSQAGSPHAPEVDSSPHQPWPLPPPTPSTPPHGTASPSAAGLPVFLPFPLLSRAWCFSSDVATPSLTPTLMGGQIRPRAVCRLEPLSSPPSPG